MPPAVLIMLLAFVGGLAVMPWRDPAVRRRAPLLLLLLVPPILGMALGPMGLLREPVDPSRLKLMLTFWDVLVGAAIAVTVGLILITKIPRMRVGILLLGVVASIATLAIAGANALIVAPGS